MNVLVSASARFALTPDGVLWTSNASLSYAFWTRYLDVFANVRVLARAEPVTEPPASWMRSSGPHVIPVPLPPYDGPIGFLRAYPQLRSRIQSALVEDNAVQLRLPCPIGGLVRRYLAKARPYAIELVGDPYDVFAPGAAKHVLRPFFRRWFVDELRHACAGACGVAYVSERLALRYPIKPNALRTSYSSIELNDSKIHAAHKWIAPSSTAVTLITVGSLSQLYKGSDTLIDAVSFCLRSGLDLHLRFVGDGKYRESLSQQAERLRIADRVHFLGQLPSSNAVQRELDNAHLFVLPSRTEGLPKALIEAMARAMPCIGSTVGGIPDLLAAEDMVPPGDARALAAKIREVISDPDRMMRMSERNVCKAAEYRSALLRPRRIALYQHLEACTREWLRRQVH